MSLFNFKRSSLKTRFIYAFVLVIIITITIISAANYYRWKHNYLAQVLEEGLILTEIMALTCKDPIIRNDFYRIDDYAKTLIKKENIAYVIIMDRHNNIMAQKPDDLDDSFEIPQEINNRVKDNIKPYLIQTYYNIPLEIEINDISRPVFIDRVKWGTVRVGFSLAHMQKEIVRNIFMVLVTGFISIVIGIIMALILVRFVTGPIEKFVHSMEMISRGDLNKEMSVDWPDEFRVLANAFNTMARALRKSEAVLRNNCQRLAQKEKMAALGRLIIDVAHEIKNPLGIIKSAAQILVDDTKDPKDKIEMGTTIVEEVNKLDIKIHDLLHYARPKPPTFREVDLNDILEKKIQFWESQKPVKKKKFITRRFNRDIPLLFLDEKQIGEMSLNMIINACEAMPDGGELIISTDWGSQDEQYTSNGANGMEVFGKLYDEGFVRVEFKDTGIGIPQENLEKIFDPFFSTKEKGSGLGLSMVYSIVDNHRGRIEVQSKEGVGTIFTIFFPAKKME